MFAQTILDICESRVRVDLLTAETHALCVDGTSAARKSSILAATGKPLRKVQRFVPSVNSDTYFPSMIGYIASGIMNQNTGEPHFNDRSYLNTLEWTLLWRIMDDFNIRFGNVYPDVHDSRICPVLNEYREMFRNLRRAYYYDRFRKLTNIVAIIDTNTHRCDLLRAHRGEGSDAERSDWRFYTYLQNMMYSELYEGLYINLEWFDDGYDMDTVVCSVAAWLTGLLDRLTANRTYRVPPPQYKLPTLAHDFTLSNITTHVYRSKGRVACKLLTQKADASGGSGSGGDGDAGDVPELECYTPIYLDVYESPSNGKPYLNPIEINRPSVKCRSFGAIVKVVYPPESSPARPCEDRDDSFSLSDIGVFDADDAFEGLIDV